MDTRRRLARLARNGLTPGDSFPLYFGRHKFIAILGNTGDWTAFTGPDAWTFEDIQRKGDKIPPDDAKKIYSDLAGLRLLYRL